MLKRKIYDDLLKWKKEDKKKCLILKGARQVGKTFIVREFGKNEYKKYIEINFLLNPEYKEIFSGSLDGKEIEMQIKLRIPEANNMIAGETLILLDEIQFCPNAITALKFLTEDGRYDYIASGSLLGLNNRISGIDEVISFPVGYVTHLELNSLDFEEFLWAKGIGNDAIDMLRESFKNKTPVHPSTHNAMMDYLKEYIVVGGMPEVVVDFINNYDYSRVLKLQRDIIEQYKDDIQKYAIGIEKNKAKACFESIPKQLAQDYKKFKYSLVKEKSTSTYFSGSLEWLYNAGIVNFCYNLNLPELPLEGNSKTNECKVYMKDTGLLVAMLEDGTQKNILDGDLKIYKGAIFENIIADIFAKNGKKLYYFNPNNSLEIDFFIRLNDKATAVEVKSADNTKSKSLKTVIANWNVKSAIRLSSKNIGETGEIDCYPLYMAIFL